MHNVENSLIYAQLSTLAWAACALTPTRDDYFGLRPAPHM